MPVKVADKESPTGLLKFAFRLPRWLYKLKLGFLLGQRFLLLRHTGRKSGRPRETVLEVAGHDPATDTFYVVAAYGDKSDWYLNLLKTPEAEIQVGSRVIPVRAKRTTPEEGGQLLLAYAQAHPTAIKQLSSFMGYEVDGTEEDYLALGELLYVIALPPRSN